MAKVRTYVVSGIVIGLCIVVVVIRVALVDQGQSETLQPLINFFVSLPLFISRTLKFPDTISIIVVVAYWVIIGGIFGWLLSRRLLMTRMTALVLIAVLAVSHWAAMVKLEGEIEAALRAVFESFSRDGL